MAPSNNQLEHRIQLLELAANSPAPKDRGGLLGLIGVVVAAAIAAGGGVFIAVSSPDPTVDCTSAIQRADAIVRQYPDAPIDYTKGDLKACNVKDHVRSVIDQVKKQPGTVPNPAHS